MASPKILVPSVLLLAFLSLLATAPLASAQEEVAMTVTKLAPPTGQDVVEKSGQGAPLPAVATGAATTKKSVADPIATAYVWYPPSGYIIISADFKKFDKKYNKIYFKVVIQKGSKIRTKTVTAKAPKNKAIYNYNLYYNDYQVYTELYYF